VALHGTAFGRVLRGKVVLVLAMVVLSVVHDLVLGPRLVAALAGAGNPGPSAAARVAALRRRTAHLDARSSLLATLPADFPRWSPLAQDQFLEIRTLLSGYLLSSQGDRMLMAHSVEGRFPFLDREVAALADSLPPAFKLRVLDEKHVLKRAAADLVPASIRRRAKQPYRAPDALSFVDEFLPVHNLASLARVGRTLVRLSRG